MLEQGVGFDYSIERVFQEYRYAGSKFFFSSLTFCSWMLILPKDTEVKLSDFLMKTSYYCTVVYRNH